MDSQDKKYPRGSEWRKWDLHVHTPESLINHYTGSNKDEKWNNFLNDLEKLPPEFKVLGINDYLFLDGYKRIKKEKEENNRLQNIDLLLPVLEFRITKFAGVEFDEFKRINLHVIFSNVLSPETIDSQFLYALHHSYKLKPGVDTSSWDGVISHESLTNLGRKIREYNNSETDESDEIIGFRSLNLEENQMFDILKKDSSHFENKYLIGIGKTEWDQLKWSNASIAEKKDIINRADVVFTAAESPESYEKAKSKLREQMVNDLLLDCSDAHYLSNSSNKDRIGNCFTWIKADPTFEGLKQIINEPEERVYIGSYAPKTKNDANVIDKIEIKNSNHWFDEEPIRFNENLVAIIGEKGAGKTALADFIALAGGDFKSDDPESFISKASKATKQIEETIENCTVKLYWRNGENNSINITKNYADYKKTKKVRYLSQSFIERKCHPDNAGELQNEIEDIIFQHISVQERMGKTTFNELKILKMQGIEFKKKNCRKRIAALNDNIYNLEEQINNLGVKKKEKNDLEIEIKQLEEQKPKPQTEKEKVIEEKLTLLNNRKNSLLEKIASLKLKLNTIETTKVRVESLKEYMQGEIAAIKKELESIDLLALHDKLKFIIDDSGFNTALEDKKKEIEFQIDKLQGLGEEYKDGQGRKIQESQQTKSGELTEAFVSNLDLGEVNIKITALESESTIAENVRKTINSFDEKIERNKKRIKELNKSIEHIEEIRTSELPIKREERNAEHKHYFEILQNEQKILEDMYSPLREKLNKEDIGEKNQINFFARIELNINDFFNKADNLIDFGKAGTYYHEHESNLLRKNIKSLAERIEIGGETDFHSLFDDLYKSFEKNDDKCLRIEDQLRKSKKRLDFYNWIFDVTDFKVNYSIKYQGTNIELLSPGKKGIVLLLMYLALDTESSIPLLIDQPEENLDNKSLYPSLVNIFKKAKKRRQIIIVTHNPNLVLNTDAEQIIVADFEALPTSYKSRITYTSGGIENSYINEQLNIPLFQQVIREHGADILEGGKTAFIKREKKYGF